MSRIVVKVGSNVLTRADGKPNITIMSGLVDQIAALKRAGHEVVLVSSGAVACGRATLEEIGNLTAVEARQLFSSVGQVRLINIYNDLFASYGMVVGQVLTQKDNFSSRDAYLNQRACILTMLRNNIVPIVNENDTASLTELMFTDNDELSGLLATMVDADTLIILSNIDGIYTGDPSDASSELITVVEPGTDLSQFISHKKSGFGRGGMGTKCGTAQKVADEGIAVLIANGMRAGVLTDVIEYPERTPHTLFKARTQPLSTVKRWIAHSASFAKGTITVNRGAATMLQSDRAVSLLPVGVIAVNGDWEAGDIITILSDTGMIIGVGRASLSAAETAAAMGNHGERPVVHYDYLYIE